MLSQTFEINHFIEEIKMHSYQDIILTADREATAARRYYFRHKDEKAIIYARHIKDFILYMRHGIRRRSLVKLNLDMPKRTQA